MKASTKRILSIAFSGVFFIATLVVYGNFIRPTIKDISIKRGEVASNENLFTNQKNAVLEVQDIISQIQSAEDFSQKVGYAIPRGTAVTEALYQVHAISQTTQTDILKFSATTEPFTSVNNEQIVVKRLGTLKVDISARGEYKNLKAFLESLETNIRVMNVKEAMISPLQQQTSSGLYTLDLKVEMYFQE